MERKNHIGKIALITGASAGIGKATAEYLLQQGYTVYGAARRMEAMAEMKPQGLHPLNVDMLDEQSLIAAVDTIYAQHNGIDILFNNAGFGLYGSIEEVNIADARKQFEVNLFGLARLTQLVIPIMRKQGAGIIINNSSIGGKIYSPLGAWYYSTKHALEGWSDCLRIELQPFGIKVVIIEPGLIKTEFGSLSRPRLERISQEGPYQKLAMTMSNRHIKSMHKDERKSSPFAVAKVVSRAIRARRPKTRYAVGKFAKLFLFMRHCFSDRLCDWVIRCIFNVRKRKKQITSE